MTSRGGHPRLDPPVVAKVKDQHILGILQLPGTLCELVVAQVLGKWEHKAAVTLCTTPSHHHPNLRTGGYLQGHSRSWTSTQGTHPTASAFKGGTARGSSCQQPASLELSHGLGTGAPKEHKEPPRCRNGIQESELAPASAEETPHPPALRGHPAGRCHQGLLSSSGCLHEPQLPAKGRGTGMQLPAEPPGCPGMILMCPQTPEVPGDT